MFASTSIIFFQKKLNHQRFYIIGRDFPGILSRPCAACSHLSLTDSGILGAILWGSLLMNSPHNGKEDFK
jgi:hypothetical protein